MIEYKTILSIIGIVLTFIAYIPYVHDILKGKTKPHVISWFIWALTTGIIYGLQVSAGAGSGAWITLAVAVIMLLIFFLSLKGGDKDVKPIDIVFLVIAIIALALWFVVKQPLLSIILLTSVDIMGFIPTFRKTWASPYSETLSTYSINTFRHALSFFALAEFNPITYLFPISWTLANGIFVVMLVMRRQKIPKSL
jgi:uncharacterized protein with PQ loop repeat